MIIYTVSEEKRSTSTAVGILIAIAVFALPLSFSFIHQVYGETNGIPVTAPVTSPVIITPTATPSPTPLPVTPPIISVTPSPTIIPTITPKPTHSPTPTPRPKQNNLPVISTRVLPTAKVGTRYNTMVFAIDSDDQVLLTIAGLPKGLSTQSCTSWHGFGRLHIASCVVRGIPQTKGVNMVTITAKDGAGHIVNKQLPLVVNK